MDEFYEGILNNNFYEGLVNRPSANALQPVQQDNPLVNAYNQLTGDRTYYNDMVQYSTPQQLSSDCAEISFYNAGQTIMTVNGIPFLQNSGFSFDGKAGERDTTRYNLGFTGVGQNLAFVIKKIYTS